MKLGFHLLSQAWYGSNELVNSDYEDEIMIGDYFEDGTCTGEFSIRWHNGIPEVIVCGDSKHIYYECKSLVTAITSNKMLSEEASLFLKNHGFKDFTHRYK